MNVQIIVCEDQWIYKSLCRGGIRGIDAEPGKLSVNGRCLTWQVI